MFDFGTASIVGLVVFFLLVLIWRSIRLLAFLQQKEYRFDRWLLFWQSSEGQREALKLMPQSCDLTRTGFRRPKITARIVITSFVLSLFLLLALSAVAMQVLMTLFPATHSGVLDVMSALAVGMIGAFLLLAALPLFVTLAFVPTMIVARSLTSEKLSRARATIHPDAKVIGITGSYGKTSTKQLLAAVLSEKEPVFATKKSFNTSFSVAKNIVDSYEGEPLIIIEYAAYTRGEIATLAQAIAPNIAIITGLTEQHLGLFGSFEAIIAAKSELVKALPPHGKVFYAADDAGAERIVRAAARNDLREVSFSAKALLPELDEVGRLEITLPVASETAGKQSKQSSKGVRVKTQLIGKQYAGAIAAAVVVARQEGCSEQALRRSLEQFEPTGNFISTKFLPAGTQIIDDGGSCNPAGFLAACELAAAIRKQPRWLLFSGVVDLGDQEQAVHERLAIAAEPVFDRVLFVGEAGVAAFVQVFGDRLVSERAQVLELLEQLPQAVLLLIEGRMPGWVQEKLTQLTAVALSQDAGAKK